MRLKKPKEANKIKSLVQKIDGKIFSVVFFLFYISLILTYPYQNYLIADEVFYYDQALKLRQGRLVNFENTQPFAYPTFLALLITENIMLLRVGNAALTALSVFLLFNLVEQKLKLRRSAQVAVLLFGLSPWTVMVATSLLTEALLILSILLSFLLYEKIDDKKNSKNIILLGVAIGIAMETHITGIILLPFFLFVSLIEKKILRFAPAALIALFIFLPYPILTAGKFIIEKAALTAERFLITSQLLEFLTIPYFEQFWPLPQLLFIFVIFYGISSLRSRPWIELSFVVLFVLGVTIIPGGIFGRHFYSTLPFLSLFIAAGVEKAQKDKLVLVLYFLFFVIFALTSLGDAFGTFFNIQRPVYLTFQRFYITPPENCTLLMSNWTYTINNETEIINLPKFDQPSRSVAIYTKKIILDVPISHTYLSFIDDEVDVNLDGEHIWSHRTSIKSTIIPQNLTVGMHEFELRVYNWMNIGGVGQVMLCK